MRWTNKRNGERSRVHTMWSDKRRMQMLCATPCNRIAMKNFNSQIKRLNACLPAVCCVWLFYFRFSIPLFALLNRFCCSIFPLLRCWCRFKRSRDSSGRYCKPTDLSNFQFNQKPCNFLDKIIFISSAAVRLSAAATRCGGFFLSYSLPLCNWFYCFYTESAFERRIRKQFNVCY